MDDVRVTRGAPALPAPATVVRQFAGSRVERQLLAQVFDLVWQVPSSASRNVRSDGDGDGDASCVGFDNHRMSAFAREGGSL
jgi:hypothetical protein